MSAETGTRRDRGSSARPIHDLPIETGCREGTSRRARRRWRTARFDTGEDEPPDPLANLLDLMLVFACGLIAALIGLSDRVDEHFQQASERIVEKGDELPRLPDAAADGGAGYESVGQVYRDPETGKLILIGD